MTRLTPADSRSTSHRLYIAPISHPDRVRRDSMFRAGARDGGGGRGCLSTASREHFHGSDELSFPAAAAAAAGSFGFEMETFEFLNILQANSRGESGRGGGGDG
jgi:hypothetical protein